MMRNRCLPSAVLVLALAATASCSDDLVVAPPLLVDSPHLYARLEMNHHAVLLSVVAPYDTVQLTTTPRDFKGDAWQPINVTSVERDSLLQANPPVYVSQDSTRVKVTSTGLIRAVGVTNSTATVRVIATRQLGGVTRADTTLVRVRDVAVPPTITTFRLRPNDSTKVAANSNLPIVLTALDSDNNPIPGVVTYLKSNNPSVVSIGSSDKYSGWNSTSVYGGRNELGTSRITSEAYVYGVSMVDTVTIRNGYPINGRFTMYSSRHADGTLLGSINRAAIQIGPGGVVTWVNNAKFADLTIEFENPLAALPTLAVSQNTGGGHIVDIPSDSLLSEDTRTRHRRFLQPGTYTFRTIPFGILGTVIVRDL